MEQPGAINRVREVEWLCGIAIALLVCIDAEVFPESVLQQHVANRAPSILLVLFGISSELYWRTSVSRAKNVGERLQAWYRERAGRLLLAWYAMFTSWWLAVLCLDRFSLDWPHALASLVCVA